MNLFSESLLYKIKSFHLGSHSVCTKINTVHKRGEMLTQMIKNKDKRKNWHFEILANNSKSKNVFEKVSKPSKRQNVLNSLFIRNISDVLSTGEILPGVLGYGIEITGVKISPCCKILHVYWQIPPSNFSATDDVAILLNNNAYKIRAELISRNVMGRVPQIFFTRDVTNAYLAAFEKAMEEVESELKKDSSVVPDDTFVSKKKNLFKFNDSKEVQNKTKEEVPVEVSHDDSVEIKTELARPADMKTDVFGLKHDVLMSKVNASRKKNTGPKDSHVILSPEWDEKGDLFSKIPGTSIHSESDRAALLKQFLVERKKLMYDRRKNLKDVNETHVCETFVDEDIQDLKVVDEDYIEEDTEERF
ncbi:uncharacterized protein TNCT_258281 [Trichonephila clavata]|uniref:Uncharacterized protein n=1 Tax=Trichonephila clavata TaxID=2740835 RepID=A0A8X6M169_TRICU|nr:uncharacterized protein TNCT_258281 [Trichonephila clavata]